ncbi:hypothetical protein [Nocardioides sp. GXQ0305]|uniref:hypothetical protein n=1 Tax=Nocardioides sp. GXQ0305 TaxID=3423912 RepID=UPI003D7E27C9
MATFNLKTDLKGATKPLYAGVGATDLAVERVRTLVAEAQKRGQKRFADAQKTVTGLDLEPKALRDQAVTRVDALAKDAKARRTAIEKRFSELQADALAFPARVQALVDDNYDELASRGEGLVTRIRRQESTQATGASAKTTAAKAKTTKTQATKATKSTGTTAKKTATKKSAPAKSSAKATATAAKQTTSDAAKAAGDAAEKVGD